MYLKSAPGVRTCQKNKRLLHLRSVSQFGHERHTVWLVRSEQLYNTEQPLRPPRPAPPYPIGTEASPTKDVKGSQKKREKCLRESRGTIVPKWEILTNGEIHFNKKSQDFCAFMERPGPQDRHR